MNRSECPHCGPACDLATPTADRKRLVDFASDSEQHDLDRNEWRMNHKMYPGIVLYAHGGFFTAYYGDAGELWGQADDDLPMFYVVAKSDPPHRTVIAPEDLAAWCEHLASIFLPVTILGRE